MSRSSVKRWLRWLEDEGFIEVTETRDENARQRTNTYRIVSTSRGSKLNPLPKSEPDSATRKGRNRTLGQDRARVRSRRYRDRQCECCRRRSQARPGIRRRGDLQAQSRPQLEFHRAQDFLWRGRLDLEDRVGRVVGGAGVGGTVLVDTLGDVGDGLGVDGLDATDDAPGGSEEHTSELQSH